MASLILLFMALFLAAVLVFPIASIANGEHTRPNIVIFMVDDLGVADLGCFGNDTIKTPNIDKLASQGARLTHNLAGESICTPSRAAFLTGRYAVRSGMVAEPGQARVLLYTSAPGGLPSNETTFAKALASIGYRTGLIGKWHLGLNKRFANDFHYHPLMHGFQFFYGTPFTNVNICNVTHFEINVTFWIHSFWPTCFAILFTAFASQFMGIRKTLLIFSLFVILLASVVTHFYSGISVEKLPYLWRKADCFLMRNFEVEEQPFMLENLTVKFTNEAIKFIIQASANTSTPFMFFMSYVKVHTALFTTKAFEGHSGHSKYGDNVEEMDWSVGQIMDAVDKLGIRENTFVYFTSDHGPHLEEVYNGEYHGGWKGIFKGGKAQSWEGGIRVPSIASWPTHIASGIEIEEPTSDLNIFPTVLKLAGAGLPSDRIIDGQDLMPLLKQQVEYSPNEFLFHYCAKAIHAVRYRPRHGTTIWKAHFATPRWTPGTQACFGLAVCGCYGKDVTIHDPPLLFDMTTDPGEMNSIDPSNQQYEDIIKQIKLAVSKHQEDVKPVPSQLDAVFWRPWLQSCCNYPYCKCIENVTRLTHYTSNKN